MTTAIPDALNIAVGHHMAGRLPEAEGIYRQILAVDAQHPQALHLLGVLAHQVGQHAPALDLVQQAIARAPQEALFHNSLGEICRNLGDLNSAATCFRQALALNPQLAQAANGLGLVLQAQGQREDAIACYRHCIAIAPELAEAYNNLGNMLHELGQVPEAIELFSRALTLNPNFPEALNNLGIARLGQGHRQEAIRCFMRAIEVRPNYAEAFSNLGLMAQDENDFRQAAECFSRALAINPNFADAHFHLANALQFTGNFAGAIPYYRRAVELRPNYAEAYNNLGIALKRVADYAGAVACYQKTLELAPNNKDALSNLSSLLRDQGHPQEAIGFATRAIEIDPTFAEAYNNLGIAKADLLLFDEARVLYARATELKPTLPEAHNNLGNALKDTGHVTESVPSYRRAVELKPDFAKAHSNLLLAMLYDPQSSAEQVKAEHERYRRMHAEPLAGSIQPHANDRSPERRLRIGYVSPDLRDHVVGRNMWPLLREHDKSQFEIVCYSTVRTLDALTGKFQGVADLWRDCAGHSEEALAQLIRADQIDILVDLSVHSSHNRILTFARKPAPVQMTFAGYPGTTGLLTVDYRITDQYLDPPGLFDAEYSEQSLRLPDSFWCYDPLSEEPGVAPLPALERGHVTFGCLNNFCKINPPTLRLWARVLKAVPGSQLKVLIPAGVAREETLKLLAGEGIEAERIVFMDRKSREDYLPMYHGIDLGLDTLPYNGHTTSLDSYWMGVPVVTLVGKTVVGRAGFSQLTNLGLTELIAQDEDEFVRIATELAGDLLRLGGLRSGLRERMRASPLMDASRFARNIESAYRTAWRTWTASAPPAPRPLSDLQAQSSAAPGLTPDLVAILNAGLAHHQAGRLPEAEAHYRHILSIVPNSPEPLHLLGALAYQVGKDVEAVAFLEQAIALNPTAAVFHYNLGRTLSHQRKHHEALASYRRAIELQPEMALAHNNLGIVMLDLGRFAEAIASFRRAVEIQPDFPLALNNLGSSLQDEGKFDEALPVLNRAVQLDPNFPEAYNNLGTVYGDGGYPDQAVACYQRALALRPEFPEAFNNLGSSLKYQGRIGESVEAFRRSVELKPDFAKAHSNLLLAMLYDPQSSAEQVKAEHERYRRMHAEPLAGSIQPHANDRSPERRLRIGYVSPDLRDHVVGRNMWPLLREHDKSQFEIVCYSTVRTLDALTGKFQGVADLWRDCAGHSEEALAQLIRADQIDILVDLSVHSSHNRILTFARKPAPVQMTFAGYPGTTGLLTVDYRITDQYLDPPGLFDAEYSEQSLRLPDSFWCYDPLSEEPGVAPLPALERGHVTFGCLNNFCKINPPTLRLWARVLHAVPGSQLHVLSPAGYARDSMLKSLEGEGIASDRIVLLDRKSREDYLPMYHGIDIGLDTLPYNGHTTSLDSYWMGVPVVTLVGKTVVGRAGFSQLTNLGLTELIAQDEDEFVRIATELAGDLPRLAGLRSGLRERMRASPLMDASRFARNIENSYRQAWKQYCSV